MKRFTNLLVLLSLCLSVQAQNPVSGLTLNMDYEDHLSDSLSQDMYTLSFIVAVSDTANLDKIHCKLGTTPNSSNLIYKIIEADGSNAQSVGVTMLWYPDRIEIDFGLQHVPLEFYANIVAVMESGEIHMPIYNQ